MKCLKDRSIEAPQRVFSLAFERNFKSSPSCTDHEKFFFFFFEKKNIFLLKEV